MVASLNGAAGRRSVVHLVLVPDDAPAVRRLDDAVDGLLDGRGGSCPRTGSREVPAGPVPLPSGLASRQPGPELGAALARVPVRRVNGHDAVEVMTAACRQACHAQAVFLRALLETGMRRPFSGDGVARLASPGEFAAEEARAALVWSRRRADSTFEFAWQVFERLPMLGEAMEAGVLDEPRARAFVQWTLGLSDDQAAAVIAALLPEAAGLLVGALIDRIKRAAIAIDPGWAERRYREAVQRRRVEGSRNDDGTANLHGLDLPIDRAAAACDRIDTLARACKRAGDGRPIDHIRADLYLGLLDGTFEDLTEDQIITHVLTHPFASVAEHQPGVAPTCHSDDADDGGSDGPSDDGDGHGDDGSDDGGSGGGSSGGVGGVDSVGDRTGSDGEGSGRNDDGRAADEAEPAPQPADGATAAGTSDRTATSWWADPAVAGTVPGRWCVRELRVEVAAMVGLNEHPAEIVGWDVIPAAMARTLLDSMRNAEWRWVVCDHDGRPTDTGITSRRPTAASVGVFRVGAPPPWPARAADRGRAGIIELQLKADELPELIAAGRPLGWDTILGDIACQHAATIAAGADAAADAAADANRRSARAALRRAVQVRDRRCTHPACRAPASRTDQDHAVDHAHGGATDQANLGCCCRHDHRLKHDGGWRLTKIAPGTTLWTSPLGRTYTSRPPPVMPALPRSWAADAALQPAPVPVRDRAAIGDAVDVLAIPSTVNAPAAAKNPNARATRSATVTPSTTAMPGARGAPAPEAPEPPPF